MKILCDICGNELKTIQNDFVGTLGRVEIFRVQPCTCRAIANVVCSQCGANLVYSRSTDETGRLIIKTNQEHACKNIPPCQGGQSEGI